MQDSVTTAGGVGGVEEFHDLLGHPKGLFVCFATELWERFSFYGMKFLLLLYLTKYHLFTDAMGLDVLGAYAGLVYALPVIGGLLADRYLGFRKAVVWGGILLSLGHLLMAVEGHQAINYAAGTLLSSDLKLADGTVLAAGTVLAEEIVMRDTAALSVFYMALALIVAGVGFLKPNISTIVGRLYEKNDARRDPGFTIFYMGINIGSVSATILCGYLGETFGWKYGFGAAGIGMVLGLITFLWGQKYLYGHAEPSNPARLKEPALGPINKEWAIYGATVLALGVIWWLVQSVHVVHTAQNSMLIVAIVGLILYAMLHQQKSFMDVIALSLAAATIVPGLIWALLGGFEWQLIFANSDIWLGIMLLGLVLFTIYGFVTHNSAEYSQTVVLMILIVSTIVFWALFEQSAASMTLYADRVVDRSLLEAMVGPDEAWIFYSVGGVLAAFAVWMAARGRTAIAKAGASMVALVIGAVATVVLPVVATVVAFAFILMSGIYFKSTHAEPHREEGFLVGASYGVLASTFLILGAVFIWLGNGYAGASAAEPFAIVPTASNFGALNALFIVILASPFAWLWVELDRRNMEPSTPVKFGLGIVQAGLGFGALVLGAQFPDAAGKVAAIWLALAYLLHTTGELMLSPVGLSAVTKLSIPRVVGVSMGTWFLATALSETLATQISKIAAIDTSGGEVADVSAALASYTDLFLFLMWLGVGVGVFMLAISPLLRKGMRDVH